LRIWRIPIKTIAFTAHFDFLNHPS